MLALLFIVEAAVGVSGGRRMTGFGEHLYNILMAHPYFTTVGAIIALYFLIPFLIDLPKRLPNEPPLVPSYLPFIGSALSFSANPYAFLSSCRARYGEIFTVNLAGRRMHFLCDPLSYPALFKHKQLVFDVVGNRIAVSVFDQGKVSIQSEEVNKAIHSQYIKYLSGDQLEELTGTTAYHLVQWMKRDQAATSAQGKQVAMFQYITDWAFEASVKAMYGEAVDVEAIKPEFYAFDKAFPLLVSGAPSFLLSAATRGRQRLNAFLRHFPPNDAESGLMRARRDTFDTHKDKYRPQDVGATQTGLLWASVANTVPAAFWTVAHLLCHPEALAAVKAEIARVVPYRPLEQAGGEEEKSAWTRQLCSELRVTESAINEALRLSTGSLVLREATAATTLTLASGATVSLRPGDGVSVYPALTHMDGRVFAEPTVYKVDRFVDAPVPMLGEVKVPQAFMPFGSGVSMCPGRHWAKNEIISMVALLLMHCEWEMVDKAAKVPPMDYSRVGIGVYQPKGDLQVRLRYK